MAPRPLNLRCIRRKGAGQWAEDLEVKQTADSPPKRGCKEGGRKDGPGELTRQECRPGWLRAWRMQTVGCSREPHRWEPPYNSAS